MGSEPWGVMDDVMARILAAGSATVVAAAHALPERGSLGIEFDTIEAASARGYFLPDEEELIKTRYLQYLTLRASLLATIEELGLLVGEDDFGWGLRLPLFATSFAAACVLLRANRFVVDMAAEKPVLWKKLDEPDVVVGIPRKSFTAIFKAMSDLENQRRFLQAADFFFKHRDAIFALSENPAICAVVELLKAEEPFIERRRREVLKRHLAYRWFSFLRRHRSAWKQVMGGLFEASGRAIADLHQPGVKPVGAPKRMNPVIQVEVLKMVQSGDVFVTRHDDALSNWFLPGYWPHAALYLGKSDDFTFDSTHFPPADDTAAWFLESKKDGVRIRNARETMEVDALLVLRPPLAKDECQSALERALKHCGKPYDFLFDFRTADRLVCTEVVYRGFHGVGPVNFRLRDVGGRLCLPAEEFIDQALACGYELVLTAGVAGEHILTGSAAHEALKASRQPV